MVMRQELSGLNVNKKLCSFTRWLAWVTLLGYFSPKEHCVADLQRRMHSVNFVAALMAMKLRSRI